MEKQIKWLWLGLCISSAGWLVVEWVDLNNQVNDGTFNLPTITQKVHSNTDTAATIGINTNSNSDDVPKISNNTLSESSQEVFNNDSDEYIIFNTDTFQGTISLAGGNIVELKLKKYPINFKQQDIPFTILRNTNNPFTLQSGLISKQVAPNHHDLFQAQKKQYQLDTYQQRLKIPLTWQQDGLLITKTYQFNKGSHEFNIQTDVKNNSNKNWSGNLYTQLNRPEPQGDDKSNFIYTYTGAAWWTEESGFQKIDFSELASDKPSAQAKDGWLGMIQHYFLATIIPTPGGNKFYTDTFAKQYIIGNVTPEQTARPNSQISFFTKAFIGPKNQKQLVKTHTKLDYAVDYGVFHIISAPLFWILEKIHSFIGNWGFSIILITLLIKLAFYKLSEKSYRSIARMKLLTPRIQQLRERYADDKQAMNQKMMQIYKEEKVNPLGGCLPILIQIPVFISLYWVLIESVELRQAPFILWIHDLSIADPYFVLPILMGISMFVQQKLNPAPTDPMQAKIMQFLPIIFTVFFLFFPAGLVLYWVINNIASITQQWYITRKLAGPKIK